MAALDDGNVTTTTLYRDMFHLKEELGGLKAGYAFLRDVTESNRKETLGALEKLSERQMNGMGQLRAELKDEMSQQERRHIDALKSLEERIAGSIDKLTLEVARAVERATQANTSVAVVKASEDANSKADEVKVKMAQAQAPVLQTMWRVGAILALAVVLGKEGFATFASMMP